MQLFKRFRRKNVSKFLRPFLNPFCEKRNNIKLISNYEYVIKIGFMRR